MHTDANIFIAEAISNIDNAAENILLLVFVKRRKIDDSPNRTPTPTKPLISSSQSSAAKVLHTEANIFIAAANNIMFKAPFNSLPLFLFSIMQAAINAPVIARIAVIPLPISSSFKDETFFKAAASIKTETERLIITVETFVEFFTPPLIRVNSAIEPVSSANKTVIAESAFSSLFLSIRDNAIIAAESMPTAKAIFSRVPAFN